MGNIGNENFMDSIMIRDYRIRSQLKYRIMHDVHFFSRQQIEKYLAFDTDTIITKNGKKVLTKLGEKNITNSLCIPYGVEEIDLNYPLEKHKLEKIKTIIFPSSIKKIPNELISFLPNLKNVIFHGAIELDLFLFCNNSSIESITGRFLTLKFMNSNNVVNNIEKINFPTIIQSGIKLNIKMLIEFLRHTKNSIYKELTHTVFNYDEQTGSFSCTLTPELISKCLYMKEGIEKKF